jgi:hypothetical protein
MALRLKIHNSRNTHIWSDENPQAIRKYRFQNQFSINCYCFEEYAGSSLREDVALRSVVFTERTTFCSCCEELVR